MSTDWPPRLATIAHHPDQYADHDDRERQLEHRPGDGAEKNALGLHQAAVMRL